MLLELQLVMPKKLVKPQLVIPEKLVKPQTCPKSWSNPNLVMSKKLFKPQLVMPKKLLEPQLVIPITSTKDPLWKIYLSIRFSLKE